MELHFRGRNNAIEKLERNTRKFFKGGPAQRKRERDLILSGEEVACQLGEGGNFQ